MNSLISSTIMYHSSQEVSFKDIKIATYNLYKYIQDRGYKSYISQTPQNYDINQAALNLGFQVIGDPNAKKTGDLAIIDTKEKDSLLKQMSLVYYGNQLGVYLSTESILCHAYSLISKQTKQSVISIEKISKLST